MGRGGTKVDLGPARARVKKRTKSKKARAAARLRAQMLKEAAAAAAVAAGRAAALKTWAAEERRLRAESSRSAAKRAESVRRVTFAPSVTVTEIPTSHSSTLPTATQTPARLRDGPAPSGKSIARWNIQEAEPQQLSFIDAYFDSDDDENGDSTDTEYKPIQEALIAAGGNSPGFVRTRSRRKRDGDTDGEVAHSTAIDAVSAAPGADGGRHKVSPTKKRKRSPPESFSNDVNNMTKAQKRAKKDANVVANGSPSKGNIGSPGGTQSSPNRTTLKKLRKKSPNKGKNHEQKLEPLAKNTDEEKSLEVDAELEDMVASLKKKKAGHSADTAKTAQTPHERGSKRNANGASSNSGLGIGTRNTEGGLRVCTREDIMKDRPKGFSGASSPTEKQVSSLESVSAKNLSPLKVSSNGANSLSKKQKRAIWNTNGMANGTSNKVMDESPGKAHHSPNGTATLKKTPKKSPKRVKENHEQKTQELKEEKMVMENALEASLTKKHKRAKDVNGLVNGIQNKGMSESPCKALHSRNGTSTPKKTPKKSPKRVKTENHEQKTQEPISEKMAKENAPQVDAAKKQRKAKVMNGLVNSTPNNGNVESPGQALNALNGTPTPKKTPKKSPKRAKNEKQERMAEQTAKEKSPEAEAELDDMFASLRKNKADRRAATGKAAGALREQGSKKKVGGASSSSGSGSGVRYTEDGLRVYTYDDLMEDQPKGLSGPCPFDCSCCF